MNVLSLFDGISCARVALERIGVTNVEYFASEIDKYAIQIAQKNYPSTVEIGSVTEVKSENYQGIDLLIGGSPCQDLSIAKKNREGLKGQRSGLFFEYVRILNEVKPKFFVLENVNSMPKEAKEQISEILGVQPVMINAALVSAQNRKRLFWVSSRLDLCYNCKYEQLLKEIQHRGEATKAQTTSANQLLSEKSKKRNRVQGLRQEVFSSGINSEMLLERMYDYQQKAERQESNATKERLSEEVLREKKKRIIGLWNELSQKQQGEFSEILQKIHFQTRSKNEKSTEGSVEKKQKDYQYDWERGIVGYVEKDKHGMCILRFYGGLDSRPYNPSEQGWDKRFGELATTVSELQFIQEGQVNICSCCGAIIPIKYEQVEIPQPEDKGILLKDILQPPAEVDERMVVNGKAFSVTASYNGAVLWNSIERKQRTMVRVGDIGSNAQAHRVYSEEGKSVALSALGGGQGAKTGLYLIPEATKKGYAIAGEGDSIDMSFPTSKTRRGRVGNKVKNIMTSQTIGVVQNAQVRKLTPIECERLQGLPDNYTEGVSNTQRYKALGNAFNVDVVAHILKHLFAN